ncbi:MAG: hypothetical protein QOE70_2179 [Chthoniobacter sp.]|nr:hypothetical protein [Chthoniobacter sp.]
MRRDGFTLTSSILPFPTWYVGLHEAISYARFLGRDHGCEIEVFNGRGLVTGLIEVHGQPLFTTGQPKSMRQISMLGKRPNVERATAPSSRIQIVPFKTAGTSN